MEKSCPLCEESLFPLALKSSAGAPFGNNGPLVRSVSLRTDPFTDICQQYINILTNNSTNLGRGVEEEEEENYIKVTDC